MHVLQKARRLPRWNLFKKLRGRAERPVCTNEPLETRTLFDLTIDGTSGNDTIIISADSVHVTVSLNGAISSYANPANGVVNVVGHAGNDSIWLKTTGTNTWYLTGNDGNDSFHVGDGELVNQISKLVQVVEVDGPGNGGVDSLLIDDSVGSGASYDMTSAELKIGSSSTDIIYNMTSEDSVTLLGSTNNDSLTLENARPNMSLQMGEGDDTVDLSGADLLLPTTISNLSVNGGGGDNLVKVFNTGTNPIPVIPIGNQTVDNIGVTSFTRMTILTPSYNATTPIPVMFSGSFCPASQVTVTGTNGPDEIDFGTAAVPMSNVRLYSGAMTLNLGTDQNNVINVYDNGDNASQNWLIQGQTVATDYVSRSVFNFTCPSTYVTLTLSGTPANDTFGVANIPLSWQVSMFGQGGNDQLIESNGSTLYPNNNHFGDVHGIFNTAFAAYFEGGAGVDTVQLDDSNGGLAVFGDTSNYSVSGNFFTKTATNTGSLILAQLAYSADDVTFLANGDGNNIVFSNGFGLSFFLINGGAGNDIFTNNNTLYGGSAFDTSAPTTNLIGGGGTNDILSVSDSLRQDVTEYDLSTNTITGMVGTNPFGAPAPHSIVYDTSMEQVGLTESTGDTLTRVLSKTTSMPLGIFCNDGNDTVIAGGGDMDSDGFTDGLTTISGGNGSDIIEFDDHLDDAANNSLETETYTVGAETIGKGNSQAFFYYDFAGQTIDAATLNTGGLLKPNTFNINATSFDLSSTTINGGNVRPAYVNIGAGSLTTVNGSMTLNLSAVPGDILTINDQNDATNDGYTLYSSQFQKSTWGLRTYQYSGVDAITLNAGTGSSVISVGTVSPNQSATVNANGGNDAIYLGSGDLDNNLGGPVSVTGGAGTDTVYFDNHSDFTLESQTLNGSNFTDGVTHSFSTCDFIDILTGPGGGTLNLSLVTIPTLIDGGSGPDTVNIGAGGIDTNLLATVNINGNGGTDAVLLDDRLDFDGGSDTYQFFGGNVFQKTRANGGGNSPLVTETGVESETLQANDANNVITVQDYTQPLNIYANGGNDQVNVLDSTTPVGVDTGLDLTPSFIFPFGDYINVNTDSNISGDAPASVRLLNSDDVYSLTVNSSTTSTGTLQIPTGNILNISHDMTLTGVIDMAGGALALANGASQITQFSTWLKNGRRSNTWTGTGAIDGTGGGAINSSLAAQSPSTSAVGFGPASALFASFPTTFFGKSVAATTMLVRYTTLGDGNLSANTNAIDFNSLATNFGKASQSWYQGDFNYDGTVNTLDFTLLASRFNSAVPAPPVDSTPVSMTVTASPRLFSTQSLLDDATDTDVLKSTWSVL